jgi:hypothetical protein
MNVDATSRYRQVLTFALADRAKRKQLLAGSTSFPAGGSCDHRLAHVSCSCSCRELGHLEVADLRQIPVCEANQLEMPQSEVG